MVYCGKPSRGCQMCRTRRIKCDETKPTCNQCAKSRRQCPGYKDDFDLVFRNETQATERRARKANAGKRGSSQIIIPNGKAVFNSSPGVGSNSLITSPSDSYIEQVQTTPVALTIPLDQQAPCFFISNYVLAPTNSGDTPRGYFDFLAPLMRNEKPGSHLILAFTAVAMASLANRPNSRGRSELRSLAIAQYTKALKATNLALQNPVQQKTDQTLAAILMLGFYETVSTENENAAAWYTHIDGAVQLVKLRGKKQLRTKVGYSLFQVVRTQMAINCMSSAKLPQMGSDWWTADCTKDDMGAPMIRLKLQIAELRVEMNDVLGVYPRTPEYIQKVMALIRRAQAMEQDYQIWEAALPDWWHPKTVAWVDNVTGIDLSKAEVCPGKVETYHNIWVSTIWNHARVARINISGIIVRCAAWISSPVDYRTTPEYAFAARLCLDLVTDVISSVPYHLGWGIGKGGALTSPDVPNYASGLEAFSNPRAIGGYFALWPLFSVSCTDYITDSQRTWAKGRLRYISDAMGLSQAKVLAGFQVRIPSMLIRRDNMGRVPPISISTTAAHPATYSSPPAHPQNHLPIQNPTSHTANTHYTNYHSPESATLNEQQYTLNPLQQMEAMQKEAYQKERDSLLKKASDYQGDSVERIMAKFLAV